jgi:NADPH-ferrihemoprotein reductase
MRKDGDTTAAANGAGAVATDVDVPDLPDFSWTVAPATSVVRRERLASASLQNIDVSSRHFFTAETAVVRAHRELKQVTSPESSTKHIEFELPAGVVYNTAGNMYILPENDAEQVEQVAKSLGYNLDEAFSLQPATPEVAAKPLFPTPCTVRDLLAKYTDLNGPARKEFLGFLVHFAVDATEKKRLMHLISKQGRDEFNSWVVDAKRSVAEVLCAFPGLKIPLQAFIHIAPRLHPRAYTIASSATVSPRAAAAVITIVNESKPGSDGRRLKGVCSNFTCKLSVGTCCSLSIRSC